MLAGMAFAIIGLVPWLVTDMHLPLQNLWAAEVSPDQMPITLLPFSQYYLELLAAMIVIGAALAGWLRSSNASTALEIWCDGDRGGRGLECRQLPPSRLLSSSQTG